MYLRLCHFLPIDCSRNLDHWKLLFVSVVLCSQSFVLRNILWSSNYDDPKHCSLRATRKRCVSLFLLHNFGLNHFSSYLWIHRKCHGCFGQPNIVRSFDHHLCWTKLLGIHSVLVESWKALQGFHGTKRCRER